MEILEIIETLHKWNFWNQTISTGFRRSAYLKTLNAYLKIPEIIALTGVRRSGKSTIVLQVIEELIRQGVKPTNTLYVNFEEPNFNGELNVGFLVKLFDAYIEFHNPQEKVYLFLDEVQLVSGWERFVSSLYDRRENIKIFVTGSSSKLLQGEISTLLSGRYVSEVIYPLSFKEFLDMRAIKFAPRIKTPNLYHLLREYLEFGGFPRIITEPDAYHKKIILTEYVNSIMERDILLRHNIRNKKDVREIIHFAFANIANKISSYNLEKQLGISSQNARRYLEYFHEAFLFQLVPFFSYSVKKQTYRPQKIFSIDSGLYNAVSFKFSDDIGRTLENIAFLEFLRGKREIYYWEGKAEIDFVLRKGRLVSDLINVCFSLHKESIRREISSLEEGLREFPKANAKIIYWEGRPAKHPDIEFVNILDFLLE